MIQHLFERMSSRREWLRNVGLGASIAVLPAATISEGTAFAKDDAMHDIMHLIKIHASSERVYHSSMVDARRCHRSEGWRRRRVRVLWQAVCGQGNGRRA